MNNKHIPPAVGELAECPCCGSLDVGGANGTVSCYGCDLQITKPRPLQNAADAWNKRAALKAQPSGVVLDRQEAVNALYHCISGPGDCYAAARRVFDAGYRLNSSPFSSGDPEKCSYQDDPRSPAELSLAGCNCVRFGEGPHWPCKLHTPVSAGGVDDRAAFEAWRLEKFCGGVERLKKCSNAPDVYYYTAEQEAWKVWQARAALAQSERVPAWIAVSERLPEPGTDVLAYGVNHRSHSYVVAGVFSGTWASQETEEATRFEPTHWMPLPAVPSAGSQGGDV